LAGIDLGNDEIDAVVDVTRSKLLTMGEVPRNLENALASHIGVKHAVAVATSDHRENLHTRSNSTVVSLNGF